MKLDRLNNHRANLGRKMIRAIGVLGRASSLQAADVRQRVIDAITCLLHLCDRHHINYASVLRQARERFDLERSHNPPPKDLT